MKIIGYCTECRRIKTVNVSSHGMVLLAMQRHAEGVCDDCRDKPLPGRGGLRP